MSVLNPTPIGHYISALEAMSSFLEPRLPMVNVCMVDFVIDDLFERTVGTELRGELDSLDEEQIARIPQLMTGEETMPNHPVLSALVHDIRSHSLESLGVSERREQIAERLDNLNATKGGSPSDLLPHFDRFMGEKKMHEVVVLTDVVAKICSGLDIGALVDLGSGKGYLSQALSIFHGLDVLAVDAKEGNREGAELRNKNLEKKWESLFRRADIRSQGGVPPSRGKNWKAKQMKQTVDEDADERDGEDPKWALDRRGRLSHATQFIETRTDLARLLSGHFGRPGRPDSLSDFGIVGLHTCGNLAADSIKIFLANGPDCRALVNVGCCYHHLDEEFYRNPNLSLEENDSCNSRPSFPMSATLRAARFELGRNARMMAAQPTDRMASHAKLPSESLLWRAVLQVIINDHVDPRPAFSDQQVGRVAKRAKDFNEYCRLALDKLGLTTNLTESEISSLYERLSGLHRRRLMAFYQVRSLFAQIVEGVILLDRLVSILQQDCVSEALLARLFDPVVSPRCYAIIAIKK